MWAAVSSGCPQVGMLLPLLWCLVDNLTARLNWGGVYTKGTLMTFVFGQWGNSQTWCRAHAVGPPHCRKMYLRGGGNFLPSLKLFSLELPCNVLCWLSILGQSWILSWLQGSMWIRISRQRGGGDRGRILWAICKEEAQHLSRNIWYSSQKLRYMLLWPVHMKFMWTFDQRNMLVFALSGCFESTSYCQNNILIGTTVPKGIEWHFHPDFYGTV
jgi:hypothetical protein